MEDGRPFYYQGNTIAAPRPSLDNIKRRRAADPNDLKLVSDNTPKVCMTLGCVWCGYTFDDYEMYCPVCTLCQFCGLYGASRLQCHMCGNVVPPELAAGKTIVRIVV